MHDHGSTHTFTRLELDTEIDRELVRMARQAPADEAGRAVDELRRRHAGLLDEAVQDGLDTSEAAATLRRCVQRYDAGRGHAFGDYLHSHLRSATRHAHRVPGPAATTGLREGRFLQVRIARLELTDELGRQPSVDELADRLGFTSAQVLDAMAVRSAERVRAAQLAARLADADHATERLDVAISELDERARLVLDRIVRQGRSRHRIARELGISTFDVADIERRARDHVARAAA